MRALSYRKKTMRSGLLFYAVTLLHICVAAWAQVAGHEVVANRALTLDGDGDYVEMPDSAGLNDIGRQVTIEAWIKPTEYTAQWVPIIFKGDEHVPDLGNRTYILQLNSLGFVELASAPRSMGQCAIRSTAGLITLNIWYHVAGVIDARKGVIRLIINGVEVACGDFGKDIYVSTLPLCIGSSHEEWEKKYQFFTGQIDEVRIWSVARKKKEIRATMHTALSGKEPGLVGYWRFDDFGNVANDSSPNRSHGKLIDDAHLVEADAPDPDELVTPDIPWKTKLRMRLRLPWRLITGKWLR